ncbi:MAG: glycosyltransferase family 2 protein [Methylococcales bacterium]|nr:glycosyltransferase [Methylococcaceae bacterium]
MFELNIDWPQVVTFSEWFFLAYFVVISGFYLLLNLVSIFNLNLYMPNKVLEGLPQIYSGLEPPVSILVPAYNEQTSIVASIQSMLQLNYPMFDVIIVNDGSKDETLAVLIKTFGLLPFPEAYQERLKSKPVRGIYRSTLHPNLRVIDKENGGKADALNAAINASHYPLFCCVDADSLLQRNSLQGITYPFMEDHRVIAVGGTVRVANGCTIVDGFLKKVGLPTHLMALFQVIEYLRAFLFGRLGWSVLGGLLIISGTFGVFRKETVIDVGGFRTDTVGEDMELVVRMHRILRKNKKPYRMVFLPDPVSWTEVPEDFKTLKNQRMRWQRGLCESLFGNMGLMFSHNGGVAGWLAFPFMLVFECFGPLIEIVGYILMFIFYWFGFISWPVFLIFMFAAIGMGMLLSLSSLLLEEMSFHIYNRPGQIFGLLFAAILENFGFRQLNSFWRLIGLFSWIFGKKDGWGEMKRKKTHQKPAVVSE